MNFNLPSKSEVGTLSPEISGEGEKVIYSDGEQVTWNAPPPKPVMPDISNVKSIRHYFNRTGYAPWPSWVYHPTEPPRLLKNQEEGSLLGVYYRQATEDEKNRYGKTSVWDWRPDCLWRPTPYEGTIKFDPLKPGQGKTYQPSAPNPSIAQHDLVKALIPEVAAAVAQALKGAGGPSAPPHVDPNDWDEFLEFKAWKESQSQVTALAEEASQMAEDNALLANKLTVDQEWSLWEEEARSRGIKVDRRWSLDRLKSEVEKASQA